jgi:hypothetical protein
MSGATGGIKNHTVRLKFKAINEARKVTTVRVMVTGSVRSMVASEVTCDF